MFDGLVRFNSVHNKHKEWDANPDLRKRHFTECQVLQRCVTECCNVTAAAKPLQGHG